MSEYLYILVFMIGVIQGFTIAYIKWAPLTPFKEGFLNGLCFKFLWRKK